MKRTLVTCLAVVMLLTSASLFTAANANPPSYEDQLYYTLTGTTLNAIHEELDDFFAKLLFDGDSVPIGRYTIIIRKAENPVTYNLLCQAMGDDLRFDRYLYVRYCEFLFSNPYNPVYFTSSPIISMGSSTDRATVYDDMISYAFSYYGLPEEMPTVNPVELDALAFLRGEDPVYDYPLDGDDGEKIRAINRYICLKGVYDGGSYNPPIGSTVGQIRMDCWGYSGLGRFMLQAAGYPAMVVMESHVGSHAWNNVFVDGYWYGIDFNLNDTGYTTAHSPNYGEGMLLTYDDGGLNSDYVSEHPVCDQDYWKPKTKPPIVQVARTGRMLTPAAPGPEMFRVAEPYLPLPKVTITSPSNTSLRVSWSSVAGADGYYMQVMNTETSRGFITNFGADVTSHLIEDLTQGVVYEILLLITTRTGVQPAISTDITTYRAIPGGAALDPIPAMMVVATDIKLPETITLRMGEKSNVYALRDHENVFPLSHLKQFVETTPQNVQFRNIVWSISDESVVTVDHYDYFWELPPAYAYRDEGGAYLQLLKPGTVTLTAVTDCSRLVATTTLIILPPEVKAIGISMETLPKTTYLAGQALDVTGGTITVTYEDQTTAVVDITPDMVTGYNPNKLGSQTLTVTYQGHTTQFTVEVKEDTHDKPSSWAVEQGIERAITLGLQTDEVYNACQYRETISRLYFCKLAVSFIEIVADTSIDGFIGSYDGDLFDLTFTDTDDAAILAAARLGIVEGTNTALGLFNPDGGITRAEATVMLGRTARVLGVDTAGYAQTEYQDQAKIHSWARPWVNFLTAEGIMGSTSDYAYQFSPTEPYQFQQALLTFLRLYDSGLFAS